MARDKKKWTTARIFICIFLFGVTLMLLTILIAATTGLGDGPEPPPIFFVGVGICVYGLVGFAWSAALSD